MGILDWLRDTPAPESFQAPSAPAGGVLSPDLIARITGLASSSALARYSWRGRGAAPLGYTKGMAVVFAQVLLKLKAGDSAARVMAAAVHESAENDKTDALSWYNSNFRNLGMTNDVAGADTLRHLFVLLIGLGMRESSGRYCEGRDRSASNTTADNAEAGMFQMSWNARVASPELPKLFRNYSLAVDDGLLSIFREGVKATDAELACYGTGEGTAFQKLCKSRPLFAVEAAAVGLRTFRKHWGPINRKEAEIRPEADKLLRDVQALLDATGTSTSPISSVSPKPPAELKPVADLVAKGATGEAVEMIQRSLLQLGAELNDDGDFGTITEQAVKHFQAAHGLPPTGVVDETTLGVLAKAASVAAPALPTSGSPPWLTEALKDLGFHETGNNQGIERFIADAHAGSLGDPWCAISACAWFERAEIRSPRSASSQSFRRDPNFVKLAGPALGAVAVYWRTSPGSGLGHVGFYLGETATQVLTLGGNESDAVRKQFEPKARLWGYWWPKSVPLPKIGAIMVKDVDGHPVGSVT